MNELSSLVHNPYVQGFIHGGKVGSNVINSLYSNTLKEKKET